MGYEGFDCIHGQAGQDLSSAFPHALPPFRLAELEHYETKAAILDHLLFSSISALSPCFTYFLRLQINLQ
jgi:hypothetical protein